MTSSTQQKKFSNKVINGDCFYQLKKLPKNLADLIIIDPPYNLSKTFGKEHFKKIANNQYEDYLSPLVDSCYHVLKDTGSLYLCTDWRAAQTIYAVLVNSGFIIQNRLTWKRDKGRAAKRNWKNNHEDIFFATKTSRYTFNPIKIKKRVIAPYRQNGKPKDWEEGKQGNFRLTYVGNCIDNVTIPFWSMKENTVHPTQKPEKLMAKLILASSNPGELVLDLFSGSGTTSVVAAKLGRHYLAIEKDATYCQIIKKRLKSVGNSRRIQGYSHEDGYFLERNVKE